MKLRTALLVKSWVSIRKTKAPLKNKIWGVYNKQTLWLSFAVEVFGFSWTNKIRPNSGECCPLVKQAENYRLQPFLCWLDHLWVLWLFKQLRIFRKRQILEKSGWEKLFGNDFSVFQNSSIRRFQPNLVKVEMTIVCHQKIKTQWSVWPRWLVLATPIAKCRC